MKNIIIFSLSLLLISCSPYRVKEYHLPYVEIPKEFIAEELIEGESIGESVGESLGENVDKISDQASKPKAVAKESIPEKSIEKKTVEILPYWNEYGDSELDSLQEKALRENFSIQEALGRLSAGVASARTIGADQYPALDLQIGGSRLRDQIGVTTINTFRPQGVIFGSNFFVRNGLSFELDIWKRLSSAKSASDLRVRSSFSDLENTKLLISDSIFREWLNIKEALQGRALLQKQIEASELLMELTELRFSVSQGTALDVYEQRQQLASLESELPRVNLALYRAKHALEVLVPDYDLQEILEDESSGFPTLSPFKNVIRPQDLIDVRPDLQSILYELQASEYDVAKAVAERFPQLALGINYDFNSDDLDRLFPNKSLSGIVNALFPLLDWGKRAGVVDLEKSQVKELLARFTRRFLEAVQEVRDGLVAEKFQRELLEQLEKQLEAARDTLDESKSRYMNGLVDYQRVLLAQQSADRLERVVLGERKEQLFIRNTLYLALGGKVVGV